MPNVDIESVGWSVSVTASNEIADKHTNTPKTKTIKSNAKIIPKITWLFIIF